MGWLRQAVGKFENLSLLGDNLTSSLVLDMSDCAIRLKSLERGIDHSLKCLGAGWRLARYRDFPKIHIVRSEEDFQLLVRGDEFPKIYLEFFASVAEKMGVSRSIAIEAGPGVPPQYVWILKRDFQKVVDRLLLQV